MAQVSPGRLPGHHLGGPLPVLAAFDQQGILGAAGVAEAAEISHPGPVGVAFVAHDVARNRDVEGEADSLVERPADHDRGAGLEHRVDVEEIVGCLDEGANRPRAAKFRAVARAVQRLGVPDPVEILVDEAGGVRPPGIEAQEGVDVREGQRERSARGAKAQPQQPVDDDRPADLVAVGDRVDHHVRAGPAALEGVDEVDAGRGTAVGFDVGGDELDGNSGHGGQCSSLRGKWECSWSWPWLWSWPWWPWSWPWS